MTRAFPGLFLISCGLATLWLGAQFEEMGVRKYARYHPDKDPERYRRRAILQRRLLAALAGILGVALLFYGLFVVPLPGSGKD